MTSVLTPSAGPVLAVDVRELEAYELAAAGAVLGRAMRDNPLHIAAVGADAGRRERAFAGIFATALERVHAHGVVLGAFCDERMVGVCAFTPPGQDQPAAREKVALLASVVRHAGFAAAARTVHWHRAWAERDLVEPHWHLGPVGVERSWRGYGVGGALLREFCARADAAGEAAYLETDKPANVRIFERFGFQCIGHAEVIGTANWFMRRAPYGFV